MKLEKEWLLIAQTMMWLLRISAQSGFGVSTSFNIE